MHVYGVDFTSAPSRANPIAVASCRLAGERLEVDDLLRLSSYEQFERGLGAAGEWIAGLDFPFGQPRRLLEDLSWSLRWEEYVDRVASHSRREFEELLVMYKEARPAGDKEHRRRTDEVAGSLSPMKTHVVPLAKMFYEGAPRLVRSAVSVPPCRPRDDGRVAIESYPALVARHLVGKRPYKGSSANAQARRDGRRKIVERLGTGELERRYEIRVDAPARLREAAIGDDKGDLVDAVLAAVQAAWAWRRRDSGFGIPEGADRCEGWIVDPATAQASSV